MLIEWIGHSCFYITTEAGKTIIIDPYEDTIGLRVPETRADIVLITHDHFDHKNQAYIDGMRNGDVLIADAGVHEVDGIKITGIPVWHDEQQGSERGQVITFLVETDGMRLLHMGDVGAMPEPSYFEQIGKIDILMIPIGGYYTVDAKGALNIMDIIRPNITIPMHYLVGSLTLTEIAGSHDFLARAASREYDVSRLGGGLFDITKDNLKKRNRIVVMECSHC
ncbi:MBL fold metallo-hydrolase [Christensenella tenuis]|uniref:MBL fold metallo-hydrolase n=1 Tax=Christensenella tenuis TaxID=2763033 RepID=A0ABR7EEB3_9FIRM|nr:MBL fold metallo-hydrolase [Christensenella tenuis]MBC5647434.1 MBL fold metallo-hydrolase [Christensenella tenuis]